MAAATQPRPTGAAVTLAQHESIRRLFARLNGLGAGISNIWVADSEFHSQAKGSDGLYNAEGGLPVPVCFVFFNPLTGEEIRQSFESGAPYPPCPISLGNDTLFVAFSAQAELLTTLRLWGKMPSRILDLEMEWLAVTNEEYQRKQMKREARNAKKDGSISPLSLLGVCAIHGISTRDQAYKDAMRDLILRGGPWMEEEMEGILDYCAEDTYDTTALLAAMWERIPDTFYCRERIDGLKAALHRGRSMVGFAWMRYVGIPIDVEMNNRLSKHFETIMQELYKEIRSEFPVFADDESFDIAPSKWLPFLKSKGWLDDPAHPWPMTKGGKKGDKKQPKRDLKRSGGGEGTIPQMALIYPELKKLSSVLEIRSCTKLGLKFPVGEDGRHRVNFWAYGTVTGRCSPSSSDFMLAGGSPAFRHLAKPAESEILIEADWSAQEVWIAAYLSGDQAMQNMLRSADPYIAFGELAGVIPWGTMQGLIERHGPKEGIKLCKKEYEAERASLKAITLGVLYGKTIYTIARECGITIDKARSLLQTHKRLFPQFWKWIIWMVNEALATGKIGTKLGWQRKILPKKERDAHRGEEAGHRKIQNSLQNFQMQAHGAEMLRLACIYGAEKGLAICAPLHDAIFVVAKLEEEEQALAELRECMEQAARDLIGVPIPIEFFVTRYPDRFVPDDKPMALVVWDKMMKSLQKAESQEQTV